jgi:hypothetical protein
LINKHQKIIANIYLGISLFLACFLVFATAFSDYISTTSVVVCIVLIGLFFSIGHGLQKNTSWCHKVALLFSFLTVLSFPIGTALAAYYFWFYINYVKKT